jgi:adenosylmethionine-8-amino-7-oxononanoate aminotransferase
MTNIQKVRADNARYMWHPMVPPAHSREHLPRIITKAEGVHVTDIDGNVFLDACAGLWNVNIGHGRPEVKEAVRRQLDDLVYYTTFAGVSNAPSIELSARLIEMLQPEDMSQVVFSSGGSDATETAFKLARQYWRLAGQPERTRIISLKYGYHGVHFGGMSAAGMNSYRNSYGPVVPGFSQVDNPYLYRNPWSNDPAELARICAELLDREIEYHGANTVAAFIAEPVQGAGGVIVPPADYWPLVRKVCDKHGVLLIADEVVTGFGRSGSMFGARGWGVKPDIMCLAKAINAGTIPLGATVLNRRVANAWAEASAESVLMHGYTYTGHPLACAAANATLDIVQAEDLPGNAARQGAYLLECLADFPDLFPSVGEVRGKGLMVGIEMVKDKTTKEPFSPIDPLPHIISAECLAQGVMIRVVPSRIILSPPLVFERKHIDQLVGALHSAFSKHDLRK